MRPGIRFGVDVGSVRVGVARSDASGSLAVPVATLRRGKGDLAALVTLVAEYEPLEVLVGMPLSMSGQPGKAAALATRYAEALAAAVIIVQHALDAERATGEPLGTNVRTP